MELLNRGEKQNMKHKIVLYLCRRFEENTVVHVKVVDVN